MIRLSRFLPTLWAACCVCGLSGLGAPAWAQAEDPLDQKFSEGFALQTLEPAPAGDWFFVTPDGNVSDTELRAMAFGSWALSAPLVRMHPVTAERRRIVKYQFYTHATASLAIRELAAVAVDIPFVPYQDGQVGAANEPGGGVFADPRLSAKLNVFGRWYDPVSMGIYSDVWLPIGSEQRLASDGSFRVNPKLILSGRVGDFVYSAAGGYLARKGYYSGSLEVGPALTFNAGLAVQTLNDRLQLGAELYGHSLFESRLGAMFERRTTPGGILFGGKYRHGDWVVGAALGPGLSDTPGAASRAVLSVAFSPSEVEPIFVEESAGDQDLDGIPDPQDACPEEAGPPRTGKDQARHGCPKHYQDFDGDGLLDWEDSCPTISGRSVSGDISEDGCPPAVSDRDFDGTPDHQDACPDLKGPSELGGCPAHQTPEDVADAGAWVTLVEVVQVSEELDRIVLYLNAPVQLVVSGSSGAPSYELKGARLTESTQNFLFRYQADRRGTLLGAALEQSASGVRLQVRRRGAYKEPKLRYQTDSRGGAWMQIDFPRTPASSRTPRAR